ncbi:conserved hypothetical protein [Culex quinquefasciatus]|uniref:MD-2-related lipid-recognition domain-containing protein n=1 Tax=Culex quinquefasciatus TaxID=7176 RepID=B0X737_CULQU|nr:conserved hypothetical protein [Culex quinquefasciatus]|eukprot:XP_001865459.1 conserved hypothetical protein [Culex quinquefasciatus]
MNASFYALLLTYLIQQSFQAKPSGYGADDVRPFTIRVTPCNVKLRRNEPTRINLEFDMPTVLDQMYARFTLNYKLKTYQPLLIDVTMEVCVALNQKPGVNPMADYVLDTIREHVPQAVHPCPYGNRYYNFSDFSLSEKFMPNTMPAGDYRIDLRVTDKSNVTMINARGYLAIRSKGLAALSMLDW